MYKTLFGVGKLVPLPTAIVNWKDIEDPEERNRVYEDYQQHLEKELQRFHVQYPHVPLGDSTKNEMHNAKLIVAWLNKHNFNPELSNLIACLHDLCPQLIFSPSAAGNSEFEKTTGGPATGAAFSKALNSEQFLWLLEAHAPYAKANLYEPDLSASEYKQAHPEGWNDVRAQAEAADQAYVQQQYHHFLQLRPQAILNEAGRRLLLKEVENHGNHITASLFAVAYDDLIKTGRLGSKVKSSGDALFSTPGMTRTDFAAVADKEAVDKEIEAALQWARSPGTSSRAIEERCRVDRPFREALNHINSR
jgi:hypothetical protein